jgi:hypothetical protein
VKAASKEEGARLNPIPQVWDNLLAFIPGEGVKEICTLREER